MTTSTNQDKFTIVPVHWYCFSYYAYDRDNNPVRGAGMDSDKEGSNLLASIRDDGYTVTRLVREGFSVSESEGLYKEYKVCTQNQQ